MSLPMNNRTEIKKVIIFQDAPMWETSDGKRFYAKHLAAQHQDNLNKCTTTHPPTRETIMITRKVKIKPADAASWMADGYYIECYALVTPTQAADPLDEVTLASPATFRTHTTTKNSHVPKEAILRLSLDGKEPRSGKLGSVWRSIKEQLFAGDLTASYTRKEVEDFIFSQGGNVNQSSEMIHRYACLRVLD